MVGGAVPEEECEDDGVNLTLRDIRFDATSAVFSIAARRKMHIEG